MKSIPQLFRISFLLTLLIAASIMKLAAQTGYSVTGTVMSSGDNQGLPGANVVVLSTADSTIIRGAVTGVSGNFTLANIVNGNYILQVTFVGYNDDFQNFNVSNANVDLGVIRPSESAIALSGVEITEDINQSIQKGDTTQFNAGAFKTSDDADAQGLLQKMPGVTNENGTIEVQGESVKQILVDGKPFFGDDPKAAMKNLPANAIDKVQVYNYKSDQSQFTGFDDGTEGKTINIITKPEYRNGTFGRVYAGYGDQDKYKGGGNINFFNNDRRITLLFQSNNVNEQNFASDDLSGVLGASGGSSGGRRGRGGYSRDSNVQDFLVDQSNGVSQVYAAGLNYTDQWGEKTKVSGSYFFNFTENVTLSSLYRNYAAAETGALIYSQNDIGSSNNMNHRFSFRIEQQLDSNNSIIFIPKFSYQKSEGTNVFTGENVSNSIVANSTLSNFNTNYEALNLSGKLLYKHKFKKKSRTLSVDVTPAYNSNIGENSLNSLNTFYEEIITTDSIDQRAFLDQIGYSAESQVAYTEPLGEKSLLQLNWRSGLNYSDSQKETFQYSLSTQLYDRLDTALTNSFDNLYHTQSFGPEYRYNQKKFQITAGVNYQWAALKSQQVFPYEFNISQEFNALLPSLRINYNFSEKKAFRFNYRSGTNPPSATQLQEVLNNSNPLNLTIGNSALKQDYQHRVFMRYNASNVEKSTTFFIGGGITYTNNYIGNSTLVAVSDTTVEGDIFLSRGAQLIKPVNLDGYLSIRSFTSYGLPIKAIKSNLNINGSFLYSRTPGLINGQLNWSNTPRFSLGFTLGSNISKEIDFTLSTRSVYNVVINSLQQDLNQNYLSQNSTLSLNWIIWKGLVLSAEVNHQYLGGVSDGFDQNFLLVNGGIGYKFLKERQAEIKLYAFDILNENQSSKRTVSDIYVEDTRSNVLQKYYMVMFTYNIRNFKNNSR